MRKICILVADAHTYVRYALQVTLPQMNELAVDIVSVIASVEELPERICTLQPDLLLLDWQLPDLSETVLTEIRQRCPHIKIIGLSIQAEDQEPAEKAGVDTFVRKGDGVERLIEAIQGLFRTDNSNCMTTHNDQHLTELKFSHLDDI